MYVVNPKTVGIVKEIRGKWSTSLVSPMMDLLHISLLTHIHQDFNTTSSKFESRRKPRFVCSQELFSEDTNPANGGDVAGTKQYD